MLVLTRYPGESIIITSASGCRIEISIIDVRGDKVRLGIEAPRSVTVHRKEIQQRIDNEKGQLDGTKSYNTSQAH